MAGPLCAFCRRQPVQASSAPFCSERCRLQDLARWIDGTYRAPGEPVTQHDTAADAHPDDQDDDLRNL